MLRKHTDKQGGKQVAGNYSDFYRAVLFAELKNKKAVRKCTAHKSMFKGGVWSEGFYQENLTDRTFKERANPSVGFAASSL